MERLTIDTKILFCDISQCRETPGGSFCEDGYCDQRRVYERLREYERFSEKWKLDIEQMDSVFYRVNALGGTDLMAKYLALGPIADLTALVKAKRDGRLVVLPCKVWETVHKATKGTPLCSVEDSEKSSFLHAKKPPVLHAHWTDKGSLSCRCSHCGCKASDEFPYCPRCYARMDEQTKN